MTRKKTVRNLRNPRAGMTLVEIMVVVALGSLITLFLAMFTRATGHSLFTSTEKLEINKDVRQFTAEMMQDARAANAFYIYSSTDSDDRNSVSDRRDDGQSGDLLLLVHREPIPTLSENEKITKIVGYFRSPDPGDAEGKGPVFRFEINYSSGSYPDATVSGIVESSISSYTPSTFPNRREVVELARGLVDENLFSNLDSTTIIVNGEIVHGNDAKRITDTYNFTISPRG